MGEKDIVHPHLARALLAQRFNEQEEVKKDAGQVEDAGQVDEATKADVAAFAAMIRHARQERNENFPSGSSLGSTEDRSGKLLEKPLIQYGKLIYQEPAEVQPPSHGAAVPCAEGEPPSNEAAVGDSGPFHDEATQGAPQVQPPSNAAAVACAVGGPLSNQAAGCAEETQNVVPMDVERELQMRSMPLFTLPR